MMHRRILTIAAAVFVLASCSASTAAAAVTTVGQTSMTALGYCKDSAYDLVPVGPAAGAYTIPTTGTLTSWSTGAARTAAATVTLKVLKPSVPGKFFRVIATDGPHLLTPGEINTFPAQIPVEAGELLAESSYAGTFNGLEIKTACMFTEGIAGDEIATAEGDAPAGSVVTPYHPFASEAGLRLNLSATVETPEAPVAAGTAVTPPSTLPVCTVPALRGKTVKAARKKLRAAHCALGPVKRAKGATRISVQHPSPGKVRRAGTKVKVTLRQPAASRANK